MAETPVQPAPPAQSFQGVASLVLAVVVVQEFLPQTLDWPLEYLGTFVHEAGHSLAAVATGGTLEQFQVQPSGAGFATTQGGYRPLVMAGGYLGTTIAGCTLLVLNSFARLRDKILIAMGLAILVGGLAFGGNVFTVAYALTAGCAFLGIGLSAWPQVQFHLVTILGVVLGSEAVSDLVHLLWSSLGLASYGMPTGIGHSMTDADQMANVTGWPAVVWALVWTAFSLVALLASARFMARRA